MSLQTTRIALAHALLVSLHPSVALPHLLPTPLPAELHALIRQHLRISIADSLLASLRDALAHSLAALCDDCKSYNAHVFGPRVVDWPAIRAGGGCSCSEIGLAAAKRGKKLSDDSKPTSDRVFQLPPSVTGTEPHAYFVSHVKDTLAAYASANPHFPLEHQHVDSISDVDAFLSSVLSAFGCAIAPMSASKPWSIDGEIAIVPSMCPTDNTCSIEPLTRLKLSSELVLHTDIIAHSPLHPCKLMYNPSPRKHLCTSHISDTPPTATRAPLGFFNSVHAFVTVSISASVMCALVGVILRS
ncbi:hypothetical protein F5I97DRAFT_1878236 [Phlebopus sp. FC_14]|nr:hypothetical protein F5I97DRAFT_1878236 [Phlebopus sp. FC_14]